jgi:hypothetical protein
MRKQLAGGSGGGKSKTLFSAAGAQTLIQLSDVPHAYTGKADDVLVVKHDETGIDFFPGRGAVNGFASLDGSGLLPTAQLPPLAITDFLGTVNSQANMLLLVGQKGDWCIRTDLSTVWIITGNDPSIIAGWTQLVYPADPGKLLISNTDTTPGYLIAKLEAGIAMGLTKKHAGGDETVEIAALLGTQSDQSCAGDDKRLLYWQKPVINFVDPATIIAPNDGDRYISSLNNPPYILDNIYEYVSGSWVRIEPFPGMALYVAGPGNSIHLYYWYSGGGWYILNDSRVLISSTDANNGYLYDKTQAGTAIDITKTGTPGAELLNIAVKIGTQSDQTCAGNDPRLLLVPVLSIFDNTLALPIAPSQHDRYIAQVTAHGWTFNRIYEYIGAAWVEFIPLYGMIVYVISENHLYNCLDNDGNIAWYSMPNTDGMTLEVVNNILAIAHQGITIDYLAPSLVDQAPGTASLRTLGTLSDQACAGNDARLSNARAPTAHASTHNAGGGDAMAIDAAAATGSLRTIGTGALNACAGNDARLSDARTPTAHASTHNAGGGDAMAIDAAAATGSLRTIGTGALNACAGNDARLSDARAPTAHAFGGASHSQDTIANIQGRLSAGKLITSAAAEISTLTEKTAPIGADLVIIEDSADTNNKKRVQLSNIQFPRYLFYGDQFITPNNADWTVNASASAAPDSLNNGLIIRAFDDTAEEGIGWMMEIPAGIIGLTFSIRARAQTAPGVAKGVVPYLYSRQIPNNSAVSAWSAALVMSTLAIPTNTLYQYYSQSITLAALGLTAGNVIQFEMTRKGTDGNDTLSGDWNLLELKLNFY